MRTLREWSITVRIDARHNFQTHASDDRRKTKTSGSSDAGKIKAFAGDMQLASTVQPLVEKALATEEINLQAVEEARSLLSSGQLDTPERINRLAGVLLDQGM